MIDVTLIGTGALQPLPERALASAAIACNGRVLLLDCGEGTQAAARRAGVSLMKIDVIALTHYHGDHTFGLPGLLQSMGIAGREERVVITGPDGLEAAMAPFMQLCPGLPFDVCLQALPPQGMPMNGLVPGWPEQAMLIPFATCHRVASQGYRFELRRPGRFMPEAARALHVPVNAWGRLQRGESVAVGDVLVSPQQVMTAPRRGISVAYTGDTALCAGIAQAARDADLFICEATYGEDAHEALAGEHGHMTFAQAARLAQDAGARALWLTHYSPRFAEPEEFLAGAKAFFPQAQCGRDGMALTLCYEK